ncbi:hypothetical protein [Nonomuraea sp. NPDC049480]|uniref:hypothetical protein n=1 Tax=Nonomuraea sp. NPDC049480 TaxID=3364353 RepID=UPI003794AA48
MRIPRKVALAIGAAAVVVGGVAAVGIANASSDTGCGSPGHLTKAIGPNDATATATATGDQRQAAANGPDCVPAVPPVPAQR